MHQSLFCSMDIIMIIVIIMTTTIIHVFCGLDDQFTIIMIMMTILGLCPQPPPDSHLVASLSHPRLR